jgi:peptide/nickel transport system substrate-binding protein
LNRHKMYLKLLMAIIAVVTILSLSGLPTLAQKSTGTARPKKPVASITRKKELVVALTPTSEPAAGFDPTTGWGRTGSPLFQSTLVTTDGKLNIVNDLAQKYTVSRDGCEYTFQLRPHVKFSDGRPLTAADVVFTFQTTVNSSSVVDLNNLRKIVAINPSTVKMILKKAQSPFIYIVAKTGIVPQHGYTEHYGEHPVGSGPFRFVRWDRGQQLIVKANPYYYGKKPYFQKITFLYYGEDTAFAAAQAGQVDIAFTNPNLAAQHVPHMKLLVVKTIDNRGISMPCVPFGATRKDGKPVGNNITADLAIRKAIAIGLNRKRLVNGVLNGYGSPAYSMCDGLPWFSKDNYFPDGRVKEAQAILAKAGWIDANKDGIREKKGIKAEITIYYTSGDQVRQGITVAVAEQLKALGIQVNIEGRSWDEILNNYLHTNPFIFGKGTLDPMELYNVYATALGGVLNNNPGFYSNPQVDRYMEQAFRSTTAREANHYWKLAQWDGKTGSNIKGDTAWVWLVNVDHLYFVRNGLEVGVQRLHPHKYGSYALTDTITAWRWK